MRSETSKLYKPYLLMHELVLVICSYCSYDVILLKTTMSHINTVWFKDQLYDM